MDHRRRCHPVPVYVACLRPLHRTCVSWLRLQPPPPSWQPWVPPSSPSYPATEQTTRDLGGLILIRWAGGQNLFVGQVHLWLFSLVFFSFYLFWFFLFFSSVFGFVYIFFRFENFDF
jgi:hypothetical protein